MNSSSSNSNSRCLVNFLPPVHLSEHSLAILHLFNQANEGLKPFKFYNMWATHHSFLEVVQFVWDSPIHGFAQFILAAKLKSLEPALKGLNLTHFSHISSWANAALDDLQWAKLNSTFNREIRHLKMLLVLFVTKLPFWPKLKGNS